jgi:hypothetical protein
VAKADGLRRQSGQKPPDHQNRSLTMPAWKAARKPPFTTAVRSRIPETRQPLKTLRPVITLRSKHGYSVTKYDASAAKSPKILRRQFGRSYDQKKVRNTSPAAAPWVVTPETSD